jgi:hypothetical protein
LILKALIISAAETLGKQTLQIEPYEEEEEGGGAQGNIFQLFLK